MCRSFIFSLAVLSAACSNHTQAASNPKDVFEQCFPNIDPAACVKAQAQAGDPDALFMMGVFSEGEVNPSFKYEQAQSFYLQAAENGSTDATLYLCSQTYKKRILKQPRASDYKWCAQAADAGDPKAQWMLGELYLTDPYISEDLKLKAVHLFNESAAKGVPEAVKQLGDSAFYGYAGEKNMVAAARLWYQAGIADVDAANPYLGLALRDKGWMKIKGCADQAFPFPCLQTAADTDDPEAVYQLALIYRIGFYVESNRDRAFDLFKQAAEKGHIEAAFNLANEFADVSTPWYDMTLSAQWTLTAAEKGHARAQYNYGLQLLYGMGVQKDEAQAIKWLTAAAEQEMDHAQNKLGELYAQGIGVPKDKQASENWYRRAAKNGNTQARARIQLFDQQKK